MLGDEMRAAATATVDLAAPHIRRGKRTPMGFCDGQGSHGKTPKREARCEVLLGQSHGAFVQCGTCCPSIIIVLFI